jgi:hypothetical protein
MSLGQRCFSGWETEKRAGDEGDGGGVQELVQLLSISTPCSVATASLSGSLRMKTGSLLADSPKIAASPLLLVFPFSSIHWVPSVLVVNRWWWLEASRGGVVLVQRGSPVLHWFNSAPVWCSVCSDLCPPWPGAWALCCAVFLFSGWCRGRLLRLRQRL